MKFKAATVDDILHSVLGKLLESGPPISPTKGPTHELIAAHIHLTNPLARLSRSESRQKIVSCLGEFAWYASRSDRLSDIQYYIPDYRRYSDDGYTLYGAYGPRIFYRFGHDQLKYVIGKLSEKPASRKAVIQIAHAADFQAAHEDVPCTCTLQFLLRRDKVNLIVFMRSNDAFKGLAHDLFCFTMIQELVANSLNKKIGHYHHIAGSLHLYTKDFDSARKYLGEKFQRTVPMPAMPAGDQLEKLEAFCEGSRLARNGVSYEPVDVALSSYWADLVRILLAHHIIRHSNHNITNLRNLASIRANMKSDFFESYLAYRSSKLTKAGTSSAAGGLGLG